MFTIIHLDTQNLMVDRVLSEDGKKVARIARLLSIRTGNKYQVRKVEDGNVDWEERERSRFATGDYLPLQGDLARYVQELWPTSYAHIAKRDPACIAYTKDDMKGRADVQSVASIPAFCALLLAKYMEMYPNGNRTTVQDVFTRAGRQHHIDAVVATSPVLFASTPEEIANVYMNFDRNAGAVASSCMRYGDPTKDGDSQFYADEVTLEDGSFFHPASVYGAGDLAVAYMVNGDGETIARALCWPEKKIYSRVYATGDTFHRALQAIGFNKSGGYYGGANQFMIGARLLMVRSVSGRAIMPYLDEIGRVSEHGDHFTIGGRIPAQYTSGACRHVVPLVITCPHCSGKFNDDTGHHVHTADGVQLWCKSCYDHDNDVYQCFYNSRAYYRQDFPSVMTVEGHEVALVNAEAHLSVCERYQNYTMYPLCTVVVDTDGRTMRMSRKATRDLSCRTYDGRLFLPHLCVKVVWSINNIYTNGPSALCYLCHITLNVPLSAIYHEDYPAYFAADGQWYHKRYKDHSPMPSPRIPAAGASVRAVPLRLAHAPVLPSFAHRYINA